jgi:enoyl-CoA hydratase
MSDPAPRPPEGDWLGTPYLRFERHPPFAHLTVDRPEARNALTQAMYFGVRYAVRRVDADPELAGLLITGTGDVFIPGGDLGGQVSDKWADFNAAPGAFDVLPFDVLRQSVKPVVSAVNGICQGGGLLIAMCSDLAVVSERATFRVPELLRGISDTYYAQLLARLIGPVRTRDLMFTGRRLSAAEALEWGLVSRVVPHDELIKTAAEALVQIVQTAPEARRDIKRVLDQYVGLQDRIAFFDSLQRAESREGFAAFIEKRSPNWVPEALRREGRA